MEGKIIKRNWFRGLLPIFLWLIFVSILFAIRTHEQLMEQTRLMFEVSLKGQPAYQATVQLDGQFFQSGGRISLGAHQFTIIQPKAETFSTNFFAWYGEHDLGKIILKRTMGTLSIKANPAASSITINGPEFSTALNNVTETNFVVPTDDYKVRAEYPHWSQTQNLRVFANATAASTFSPHFGSLHLTCNRNATFDLRSADGENMGSGNFPSLLTELPIGNYQLTVSYHIREVQQKVFVQAEVINEMPIEFSLGALHIESVPTGASVNSANGNYLGQTPLDLNDLTPQLANLKMSLFGYEPVAFTLKIVADRTNFWNTNLISSSYLLAMRDAERYMGAFDYEKVVQLTSEALRAKPQDAEALALQTEATKYLNTEQSRLERLKRPQQVFEAICAQNPDANLFEAHELKTTKSAKEIAPAIVKALKAAPYGFEILQDDDSSQPDIYQITARQTFSLGILGGNERICLLVIGQTKDNETEIWFKVIEYDIQHILVNFKDVKQLIPMHPSRIQMSDMIIQHVQEGTHFVNDLIETSVR